MSNFESVVNYLTVSFSGFIASVGEESGFLFAIDYSTFLYLLAVSFYCDTPRPSI